MANLEESRTSRRNASRRNHRRFYTSLDMAIVKKDIAIKNSQANRGEIERTNNQRIFPCGCGVEGCFIHFHCENS